MLELKMIFIIVETVVKMNCNYIHKRKPSVKENKTKKKNNDNDNVKTKQYYIYKKK
jgi:hypothetical protein